MSALTDAVAKLESGGSSINAPFGGYANYRFQQFQPFVSQYGFGEAGVTNYANQVLQANPNATFGDMYGGYVTGTGNPASANINSLLTTTQPGAQGAYQNLITNSPIAPNTPLSSLLGSNDNLASNSAYTNPNSVFDVGASGGPSNLNVGGLDTFTSSNPYPYAAEGGINQYAAPLTFTDTSGQPVLGSSPADYGQFGENFVNPGTSGGFGSTSDIGAIASGGSQDLSGGGFLGGGGASSAPTGSDLSGSLDSGLSGGGAGTLGGLGGSGLGGLLGGILGGSNSAGSGDPTFFAWLGDWAIRGAIILLGFVFCVGGLYMLKGNTAILKDATAALK